MIQFGSLGKPKRTTVLLLIVGLFVAMGPLIWLSYWIMFPSIMPQFEPRYDCMMYCNNNDDYGHCEPWFIEEELREDPQAVPACACQAGCNCERNSSMSCSEFCSGSVDMDEWHYMQSGSSLSSKSSLTFSTYSSSTYSSSSFTATNKHFHQALEAPSGLAACLIGCAQRGVCTTVQYSPSALFGPLTESARQKAREHRLEEFRRKNPAQAIQAPVGAIGGNESTGEATPKRSKTTHTTWWSWGNAFSKRKRRERVFNSKLRSIKARTSPEAKP